MAFLKGSKEIKLVSREKTAEDTADNVVRGFWYVLNAHGKVIVKCGYKPDQEDLASRGESAIFSKKDIPLDIAEFRNGKIVEHILSREELIADLEEEIKQIERTIVNVSIEEEKARELKMGNIANEKQEILAKLYSQLNETKEKLERLKK